MKKVNSQLSFARFSTPTKQTFWRTLTGCLLAIRTVIWTPPHEERVIHRSVNQQLLGTSIALNPSRQKIIDNITLQLPENYIAPRITARERLGLFAALMQFTMYLPTIRPYFRATQHDITALHDAIIKDAAAQQKPANLAEQFSHAMAITRDPTEALWLLLVTTRQYARWYDGEAIDDFRPLTQNHTKRAMKTWYQSVAALKPHDGLNAQDSAGDTYYVWTHAMAKLVFGPISSRWAIDAHFYRAALHIGTWLNHTIAHRVSPQSVSSNHSIAANYGNAIGTLIAKRALR